MTDHGLSAYDADVLTSSRELGDYYDAVAKSTRAGAKVAANWVMGEVTAALNRDRLDVAAAKVSPAALGSLLDRIADGTISGKIAKEIFEAMWSGGGDADVIIKGRGLEQISNTESIEKLVADVLAANPEQVAQFRAGKAQVLGYLVGQVMKASGGKANPQQVNKILRTKLGA
jgi:aspartyl-tRNA(Asn)/glutamyl-tRNA(Gln) amidotransferase subunit B